MTCEKCRDNLVDMLYGEDIGPAACYEFFRHLQECRECDSEFQELLATRETLASWSVVEPELEPSPRRQLAVAPTPDRGSLPEPRRVYRSSKLTPLARSALSPLQPAADQEDCPANRQQGELATHRTVDQSDQQCATHDDEREKLQAPAEIVHVTVQPHSPPADRCRRRLR